MNKTLNTFGIVALCIAGPLSAQDAAADAVEAAIEAADAAANQTSPPDVQIQLPAEELVYSPKPELIEFSSLQMMPGDYPPEAWVADEEGSVYYSLAVDAEGGVTDCTILESSGSELLDAKTCEIALERAQFRPATDRDGSRIAGEHRDHQVWSKREPEFPGTATINVEYTLTAMGKATDCEVIEVSGEISRGMRRTMEEEPCPGINRPAQAPFRDENGHPVDKRVNVAIVVVVSDLEE